MRKIENRVVEMFRKVGWAAYLAGLENSHSGNMSVRVGNRVLITRRGSMLGFLKEEDIVEIGLYEDDSGISLASSESGVHRAIYRGTDALAILHAHTINAVVLSLVYDEIIPIDVEGSYVTKRVPVLEFEFGSGSKEMEEVLPRYLKDYNIVMVKGHGAFSIGETLEEALFYCHSLENSSKIILGVASMGKDPMEYIPNTLKEW